MDDDGFKLASGVTIRAPAASIGTHDSQSAWTFCTLG
jgi:hypothetical protein